MESQKLYFLAGAVLLWVSVVATAELDVYRGDSVTISDANFTITWGINYTFNVSSLNLYNDTLELNRTSGQNWNISITSNSTEEINSTLYRYNLSQSPELGETVLKVETAAAPPSTVNYRFTGIPGISNEHYVLQRDSSQVSTHGSGGTISWSHDTWDSDHNFTLTYEKKPDTGGNNGGNQGDGGSSGGIDVSGGITIQSGTTSDSHTWIAANTNRFTFDSIDEKLGLEEVTVETQQNQSNFKITVQKPRNTSSIPRTDNQYTLYQINTSTPDQEITDTRVRFQVNQSFATQYDQIVLSRYQNRRWNDLPTQPVETKGETWLYEASSTGFSYYTVKGKNQETPDNQSTQNQSNQTQQQGNQISEETTTTPENETRDTTPEPQEGSPWLLITAGIIFCLTAATVASYLYYRNRKLTELQQETSRLQTQLQKQARDLELDNPEHIFQELNEAEQLIDNKQYRQAEKKLREIEKQIE